MVVSSSYSSGYFFRYLCIIGGVGVMVNGSLPLYESLSANKIMNEIELELRIEADKEEKLST